MQKELKDKWIAALRSGEYKQGTNYLKTSDGRYCCLGVLADICKLDLDGTMRNYHFVPVGTSRYPEELTKSGATSLKNKLSSMNDGTLSFEANPEGKQHSFLEIADWIENNIPTEDGDEKIL